MKKRIGLIIQGPMTSSGIRGPLLRDKSSITEKSDDTLVDFNCIDNVIKLATEAKSIFDYVVLSTWESNEIEILSDTDLFDHLIVSNEGKFEKLYINDVFNNNYKKQFHTLKVAGDHLEDKNLDFIVKIRTDLFVDLKELHKECLKSIDKNTILINNGIRSGTRFIELDDYIFGSESKFFIDWMNNLLSIEFFDWGGSHHRLMKSYLWTKYENKFKYRKIHFFHQSVQNNSKKISNLAIQEWKEFHILDKNFWKNSQLRGEALDKRYFDFKIEEPSKERHKFKYNFKLYLNWLRRDIF